MNDVKKGLRLLSISVFVMIAWAIFNAMCPSFLEDMSTLRTYLPMITQSVLLVCSVVDLIGLIIIGRKYKHINIAWKLKIVTLVFVVIALIISIVVAVLNEMDLRKKLAVYVMVADILAIISNLAVFYDIIKSITKINPTKKEIASYILILYIIYSLLIIVMEVLSYLVLMNNITSSGNDPVFIAYAIIAIIFMVCSIIFTNFYLKLIISITNQIDKAKTK